MGKIIQAISQFFADIIIEKVWGYFLSFALFAGAVAMWHSLTTEQPGIAIIVGILLFIILLHLIKWITNARRKKRSSDNEGGGLEFFETRGDLEQKRPLTLCLPKAANEDQILVTGRKFAVQKDPDEYLNRIRKIILPKPNTQSVIYYAKSTGDNIKALNQWIRDGSKKAQERGIGVKWSDELI